MRVACVPAIDPHHVGQWRPRQPAGGFQFRLAQEMRDIADAEIGGRLDRRRDANAARRSSGLMMLTQPTPAFCRSATRDHDRIGDKYHAVLRQGWFAGN
jgi:hypothetical protein